MKSLDDGVEIVSGDIQTDSYGSRSDASGGKFVSSPSRPKMEVVCVIDLHSHHFLSDRKRAFEDVKHACAAMNNVALTHIQVRTVLLNFVTKWAKFRENAFFPLQFEKLDFGETNVLDQFYNADVAIIDLSIQIQQSTLFYHLGVRESFGMKQNILLFNEQSMESFTSLESSCASYNYISYKIMVKIL